MKIDLSKPQKLERKTLYLVSTPIGNLKGVTLRALEVLEQADIILAEDTREVAKLLNHYEIEPKRVMSYREQIHTKVAPKIIHALKRGKSIALASDRGTPLISDPGFPLVSETIKHDLNIIPIPGPSAVLSALVVSGAPPFPFVFIGFLPRKGSKRKKIIQKFGKLKATLIIYESPFRVKKTLKDLLELVGDRQIAVCAELTKLHEGIARGKISQALKELPDKLGGEFTLVVYPE